MISRSLALSLAWSAVGSAFFRSRSLTFVLSEAGGLSCCAKAFGTPPPSRPSATAPATYIDLRDMIHRSEEKQFLHRCALSHIDSSSAELAVRGAAYEVFATNFVAPSYWPDEDQICARRSCCRHLPPRCSPPPPAISRNFTTTELGTTAIFTTTTRSPRPAACPSRPSMGASKSPA